MAQKKKDWNGLMSGFKASDLMFLDESGFNTDMTRRFAYSLSGSRAVNSALHGTYQAERTLYDFLRWNDSRPFQTIFGGYFAASSER